jgi:hypothetical protein
VNRSPCRCATGSKQYCSKALHQMNMGIHSPGGRAKQIQLILRSLITSVVVIPEGKRERENGGRKQWRAEA